MGFLALGLARDPGCGGDVDAPSSGVNAPCTRDKDCTGDLSCVHGVCTSPSQDGGPKDGTADSAADAPAND
jgi:hypothetical protein